MRLDHAFPTVRYLRLKQIIGSIKEGIPPIIPVSKSTWWAGVRTGRFPSPHKIGPKTTVWSAHDIAKLAEDIGNQHPLIKDINHE